ncbi:transmembrane protein 256-like [Onthophagus taurus]|uniref:transmembrane protein 256-like n=1 Tax=Onthophagus taurus TaxID=166361 RepID=UPI000C20DC60|nr:transmembrane protein 256-like [Onthophagus taurus]
MFGDAFNYIAYDNPLSKGVVMAAKSTYSILTNSREPVTTIRVITEKVSLHEQMAQHGPILKIAGAMGAFAVALGAYGAHKKYPKDRIDELKSIYETANKFHFFHTLALFGVPFSKQPKVTATLFVVGITLFSGPCYYRAFTGENKFGKLAPVGGSLLIIAWLSFMI